MKKVLIALLLVLVPVVLFAALSTNETKIVNSLKGVHTLIVIIGCIVCLIGFAVGATKSGAGDEFGQKLMIGAAICFFALLLSKPIFNAIMDQAKKGQVQNADVENVFK